MPQVTIHIPDESTKPTATKTKLASDILSKHGLSLSKMHPNTGASALQPFNLVVVPDLQTAKDIVAELQSNGISAFLKPQASAP
jgi:hypothetical protein